VTTFSTLSVVLEASAILVAIALTNRCRKARFEYGIGAIVNTISNGLFACPCLLDALGSDTSARRKTNSSWCPVGSPLLKCIEATSICKAVSTNVSFRSHHHYGVYCTLFSEPGMNQSLFYM